MLKINILLLPAFAACALLLYAEKYKPMDSSQSGVAVIDGPYVSYRNDSIFVNYIEDNGGTKSVKTDIMLASSRDSIHLLVNTGRCNFSYKIFDFHEHVFKMCPIIRTKIYEKNAANNNLLI